MSWRSLCPLAGVQGVLSAMSLWVAGGRGLEVRGSYRGSYPPWIPRVQTSHQPRDLLLLLRDPFLETLVYQGNTGKYMETHEIHR